ncbi:serine/threonine-protein phosphatase 7 long form protein [Trifolium repens]|nr:serine/threonine-protein phosphatase 7 long form protein [Trifolium repens]
MASTSFSRNDVPLAVDDKEPVVIDGSEFVSEPAVTAVEGAIWEEELIIPHKLEGKTFAFAGPFPSSDNFSEEISSIFPLHVTCEPKIFAKSVFDMSFFEPGYRAFRSAPVVSESYLKWLNKVEKQYATFWKESGIFDLIQLSREGPKYNAEMLIAALHFWENSTNTFHLKAGMMTPTLFDVAAITGLRPTGPTFDPKYTTVNHQFDFKVLSLSGFLKNHHDLSSDDVSPEEHIAFLTYWLSHFVLCTSSLQVVKRLVPLAIMLHQGLDVALGRFILASLYDSLGQASDLLKKTDKGSQLTLGQLGVERRHLGLVGYQPNLVARQFGLSQFRPKSLFKNKDDIVLGNSGMSVEYFERRLKLADERSYKLTPIAFEISHFCTYEFTTWWSLYYEGKSKGDEEILGAIEAGFDALQPKTPKGKGVSKTKDANTSTDSTAPAVTSKKSLPNTGAKLRKRTLMASNETGEPTKQKKQKALTIQEPSPADATNSTAATPSGEGQRDKEKASVETSEASMPTIPKKKVDKEKKKKKKVKANSKPSAGPEKDIEIPHSNSPVENQPTTNVEAPSTKDPAPRQKKVSSCSQDPGAKDGNEEDANMTVNDEENLAQDVETNGVEANLDGNDKDPEIEDIQTTDLNSDKTILAHLAESTQSSEGTDVEMASDNGDEVMPEAAEGGSEILPVSSTSKLSADIGLSEMQFIAMKDSDPAAALKMLLSSKDYINQDVFSLIEANPSSAFSHLGFLKKLHNPITDGATLSKVIQLENLIDGFTQAIQKRKINALKLEAQTHAHAALVEKAKTAQANVERLEKEIESNAEITEYNQNITAWENEIAELNLKIQSLNAKIDAEKVKRDEAKANLSSAVKAQIDKEANEGIKFFSASAAVDEEIENLVKSNKVLDTEVSSFKNLYEDLKKQFKV